jgi:GWxTD domain-containing protein
MTFKTGILFLLFALALGAADNKSPYPLFYYDIVAYADKQDLAMGRIDIFLEVVYDDVQFVKVEDTYKAEYELSAIVMDGREQVDGDIWKESFTVDNFDATNSRNDISLSHKSFTLEPGKYTVQLRFEDVQSGKTYETDEKIRVEDYSKPDISASEVMFARKIEFENGQIKSIFPEVTTRNKGLGHPSYAYFEIYNPKLAESAELTFEIRAENSDYKKRYTETLALNGERSGYSLELPTDSLQHDRYTLGVEIVANNKKAELQKPFYVRWSGLPRNAGDLDEAIMQVHYIATREEWKKMRKASEPKKLEYFIEFWKNRDPSPGTDENEAMQSYYARVEMANQSFSVMGRKGWQTDRGLVFIILGPPNEVIQNNYPSNSRPYHIWQYYAINRQFEFFDRNGFGDFEFINPLSIVELQRFAELMQ